MRKLTLAMVMVLVSVFFGIRVGQAAQETMISDITSRPGEFMNATVVIKGTVMNVNAEPAGTNKGTYKVSDDSEAEIVVKTKSLPAIGKTFVIQGVVAQNPDTGAIYIKELNRSGSSSSLLIIAIAAGAVLLVLVVIIIVMVTRKPSPKPTVAPATVAPTVSPSATIKPATISPAKPASDKTISVSPGASAGRGGDQTIVALSVSAEIVINTGRDSGKRFPLLKPIMLIGRSGGRSNDVELADASVSREQAKIMFDQAAKTFTLINESSTNPSKINGDPVASKALSNGDDIEFGTVKAKFRVL